MNNFQNTEKFVAFIVFDLFIVMPLKFFFWKTSSWLFSKFCYPKKKKKKIMFSIGKIGNNFLKNVFRKH